MKTESDTPTPKQAKLSAQRFINHWFNNNGPKPCISIPAHSSDDDLRLMAFIGHAENLERELNAAQAELAELRANVAECALGTPCEKHSGANFTMSFPEFRERIKGCHMCHLDERDAAQAEAKHQKAQSDGWRSTCEETQDQCALVAAEFPGLDWTHIVDFIKPIKSLKAELNAAQARIAELDATKEDYATCLEELNKSRALAIERMARIAELEAELESHAWEISPAMAQAKIDELNAKIERLEAPVGQTESAMKHAIFRVARKPPAPKYLERPDAPGWWWCHEPSPKTWGKNHEAGWRVAHVRMEYKQDDSGERTLVAWFGVGYDVDTINVHNLMGTKWLRATPPQWTPTSEGGRDELPPLLQHRANSTQDAPLHLVR